MPKKKNPERPEDQSERFKRDAERLIEDGSLSPTEADRALDKLVRRAGANPTQAKTFPKG